MVISLYSPTSIFCTSRLVTIRFTYAEPAGVVEVYLTLSHFCIALFVRDGSVEETERQCHSIPFRRSLHPAKIARARA